MKWVLLVLVVSAALFLTLGLVRSWLALDPYETLHRALQAPEDHLAELWQLARREDGAGWIARLELSKVLLARGEGAASVALLQEAVALYETQEAHMLLARALEMAGCPEEALTEWKKLLPAPEAAEAVLRLEKDGLAAARSLVASGAYTQALTALSGWVSAEALLLRARALAGLGRHTEAAQEYERYLALVPKDAQACAEYGQVLERLGQTEKALDAYRAAGASGAYRLGLLLEAQNALNEALLAYLRSPEPEAQWRAALLLERQGRPADAIAIHQRLAQSSARVADDAAFRLYILFMRQGWAQEAAAYKALLPPAFLWLSGETPSPPSVVPDPLDTAPDVVSLADHLVVRFSHEGREWAHISLAIALSKASAREALCIGEWYAKMGDWRRAYTVGVRLLSALPCRRAYRLAYPKAWEESVLRWSSAYGVDPFLVWAVIREESGFLPTAVSRSGARGLMQLLPSTARWIAEEKLRIPYREELLFDPDYNVRLGTWYLRHLLDQFGGNVAMAVAAYNGGPGNLRRWTADLRDPLDFPAHLRSAETREYLTKVLNAWLIYRWLYS